ncbi:adenylosuccinate lyase [Nonlabens spongiae]|uniref:Adenylosuccinate lyase n=1 Tax=Nonlabens spongiae TaxID=331648 RepID=A0A1W6MJ22_9FLAO|nr:adenylosuccinate lyase [Nonlabens spongiae]ARN77618.1 adenylosuccinate lyase [Nonlabens spongiae]
MSPEDLHQQLKALKAYKKERVRLGKAAVEGNLLPDLIKLCKASSKVSHQACWCLEQSFLLFEKDCYPHLCDIARLYEQPIDSSGMRSLTKIASICCKKFYSPRPNQIKSFLNERDRAAMVEGCFRTLLEHEGKTANQAFATRALFELGKEFEWVHEALLEQIERIMSQNPQSGYRAVAKEVSQKIQQLKNR